MKIKSFFTLGSWLDVLGDFTSALSSGIDLDEQDKDKTINSPRLSIPQKPQ